MIRNSIARAVSSLVTRPVNGAKLSFEIVMKKLFANGEQGFWYDPSDMGTMYQDAAGTTAVNASGQPLGLMLDNSKGLALGPELITNGDFSAGTDGWTLRAGTAYSVTNGALTITNTTAAEGYAETLTAVVAGKWYKLTLNVLSASRAYSGSTTVGGKRNALNGVGSKSIIFLAVLNSALAIGTNSAISGDNITIDNVSVKEIQGNHAYQTTSAARPILQDAPRRIDFDTVDDKLITNLPTQLTGCTVIRSVPNVGTQILTGQIIPATYEDNKDHCGLIVINRALTPSETSAIAAEFNKRAGV